MLYADIVLSVCFPALTPSFYILYWQWKLKLNWKFVPIIPDEFDSSLIVYICSGLFSLLNVSLGVIISTKWMSACHVKFLLLNSAAFVIIPSKMLNIHNSTRILGGFLLEFRTFPRILSFTELQVSYTIILHGWIKFFISYLLAVSYAYSMKRKFSNNFIFDFPT